MFRLLVKTHNKTGLNYLCVTEKENYEKYAGSGLYWKRHIKEHGSDITTVVLYESETKTQDFIDTCLYYSTILNVVESSEWANLIPENANSVGYRSSSNEETIFKIKSGLKRFYESEESIKTRDSISKRMKHLCSDPVYREEMALRRSEYVANIENRETISKQMKDFWKNADSEFKHSHSEKTSIGRLLMSEDAKKSRADKITKSFANSEKRKEFELTMKTDRLGGKNPYARQVYYYGKIFDTRTSFYDYIKSIGVSKNSVIMKLRYKTDPECYLVDRVNDSLSKTINQTKEIKYESTNE